MKILLSTIFLIVLLVTSSSNKTPETTFTPAKERKIRPDSVFLSNLDPFDYKYTIRELYILNPTFRNKVIKFLYEARKEGIDLRIVETYRTPERQNYLKQKRRTMLSGGYSKHQHLIAVDVVAYINGKPQWHNYKLWDKIGKLGEKQGLFWGGRWRKFKDYPHFELKIPIDSIKNIPVPDTVLIPLF